MSLDDLSRNEQLDLLAQKVNDLDRYLSLPESILVYQPTVEDAWTTKEHVVHMADAELVLYAQVRLSIAQPGQPGIPLSGFVRGDWNKALAYNDHPLEEMVDAFRKIRSLNHHLYTMVAEKEWDGYYVQRPDGQKRTLKGMLGVLITHPDSHVEFTERNKKLWEALQ